MKVHSLAISGLVTLDIHSLNNEGAEGNYLQTRQVQIVDKQGNTHAVNAVSGDMFKHIQAEHLFGLAKEQGLPLCNPCQRFDANRIVADTEFAASFPRDARDSEILSEALRRCVIDDAEGVLITSEVGGRGRAIARKSVLEFGWVVGRPETTRTESYFHVKYVPEGRGRGAGDETGAGNVGQNIFHRPASSGQYAVVVNVDLYRLGRNDITLEYVLPAEERARRAKAVLQSLLLTFLKPTGAHRNTQHPHVVDFQGRLALSAGTVPAPIASALNGDYAEEIDRIKAALDKMWPGAIVVEGFEGLGGFAEILERIVSQAVPYGS